MKFESMSYIHYFVLNCLPELEVYHECKYCGFLSEVMDIDVLDINPAGCNTVCQLCPYSDGDEEKYMYGTELLCLRDIVYRRNTTVFKRVNNWFDLKHVYNVLKEDIKADLAESGKESMYDLNDSDKQVLNDMPKPLQKVILEVMEIMRWGIADTSIVDKDKYLIDTIQDRILKSEMYSEELNCEEVNKLVNFVHNFIIRIV